MRWHTLAHTRAFVRTQRQRRARSNNHKYTQQAENASASARTAYLRVWAISLICARVCVRVSKGESNHPNIYSRARNRMWVQSRQNLHPTQPAAESRFTGVAATECLQNHNSVTHTLAQTLAIWFIARWQLSRIVDIFTTQNNYDYHNMLRG